jgi:GLPGLI family protein
MKKIFLITILLFSLNLYSQSGKAFYNVYSINKNGTEKLIKGLKFELIFNSNEYIFKKVDELDSDGTSSRNKIINRRADVGIYYRNIQEKLKFVKFDFLGFPTIRKDTLLDKHWNLTNKSKIINNYECKNANIITTNEYNGAKFFTDAWYYPNISMPYGPNGFDGLPGLIISLETLNLKYVLYKLEFSDKKLKINPPKGKPMTNDEIISFIAKKTGADEKDLKTFFSTKHYKND